MQSLGSIHALYSNLLKGLPYLECFGTVPGIGVIDTSNTIIDTSES